MSELYGDDWLKKVQDAFERCPIVNINTGKVSPPIKFIHGDKENHPDIEMIYFIQDVVGSAGDGVKAYAFLKAFEQSGLINLKEFCAKVKRNLSEDLR